jgi:hypothetical protein
MVRWVKVVFIGTLLLVIAVAAALWSAAHDPRMVEYAVRAVWQRYAGNVELRDFHLAGVRYVSAEHWVFDDVRWQVVVAGKVLSVSAAGVIVDDVTGFAFSGRDLKVRMEPSAVFWGSISAARVSGSAEIRRVSGRIGFQGHITAPVCTWDKLTLSNVSVPFEGNSAAIESPGLSADIYGGRIFGKAGIMPGGPVRYHVDFVVGDVDAGALAQVLGGALREFGGSLSGTLQVSGAGTQIDAVDAALTLPRGGEVSAALLSSIAGYLPASREKKRLDTLIRSGGKLAVEAFSFTIKNDTPDHFSGLVGLKSRAANLELNVAHDIRVDARIDALIRAWQAVFKR